MWIIILLALCFGTSCSSVFTTGREPCEFEGLRISHNTVQYLVGQTHKLGSIYASCIDGHLSCFEDNGLADAPVSYHQRLECDPNLVQSRRRQLGVAISSTQNKWPNNILWYRISETFNASEVSAIQQAITTYEATDINISFQVCDPVAKCENAYVNITQKEDVCYSFVGYANNGQPQVLNLGKNCFSKPGAILHELGHSLGLFHEHTHPERQVIILTDTNLPVSASNYAKAEHEFLKPYDLASVMHYGREAGLCLPKSEYPLDAFCDVEATTNCIMPVKSHCDITRDGEIGHGRVLSPGDLDTLKALYGTKNQEQSVYFPTT